MRLVTLSLLLFVLANCETRPILSTDQLHAYLDFRQSVDQRAGDTELRDRDRPNPAHDAPRDRLLPDTGFPTDTLPHERRVFEIAANLVHTGKPNKPSAKANFVLDLARAGNSLSATVGTSAGLYSTGTVAVQGTYASGAISLVPFQFSLVSGCYGAKTLSVSGFAATSDWKAGTISGTFVGTIRYQEDDILYDEPIAATFSGGPDTTSPIVNLNGASLLDAASLVFSEPVQAPVGSMVSVTTEAGAPFLSVPFSSPIMVLPLPPVGAWPFGATFAVTLPAGVTDLALNAISLPSPLTFSSMKDPGVFQNPGFEPGASGFPTGCPGIVKALGSLTPKQGLGMAYFDKYCLSSQLILRLDLPSTASKIVIAVDVVSSTPSAVFYPSAPIVVAGSSIVSVDILKSVGAPASAVPGATSFPQYHSGFVDIDVNVAALAGQTVALVIGSKSAPLCGPPLSPQHGYLLDDLRVQ